MSRRAIAAERGKLRAAEESPDCTERGVLSIRKDAADHKPRKDQCNREQTAARKGGKGERVGQEPTGRQARAASQR